VSTSEIRNKARRRDAQFIDFFMIVVVDLSEFIVVPFEIGEMRAEGFMEFGLLKRREYDAPRSLSIGQTP